jgi:5'-methylthioadenosine phosphorylase
VQTSGPRIETKAEVRALSHIGDVVGMTIASEATLANELDIPFSAICMVDNYAHGIGDDALSYEQILSFARANTQKTEQILERIIAKIG